MVILTNDKSLNTYFPPLQPAKETVHTPTKTIDRVINQMTHTCTYTIYYNHLIITNPSQKTHFKPYNLEYGMVRSYQRIQIP